MHTAADFAHTIPASAESARLLWSLGIQPQSVYSIQAASIQTVCSCRSCQHHPSVDHWFWTDVSIAYLLSCVWFTLLSYCNLSVYLSIYLSVYLSISLSNYLSVRLSAYLSTSISVQVCLFVFRCLVLLRLPLPSA